MTPKEFVDKYYKTALDIEKETMIPAVAILAQSALESSWGNKAIGFNLWGIKYRGQTKLFKKVLTTEYSKNPKAFQEEYILSREKVGDRYKFKVWQYFCDYKNQKEAFSHYANLLLSDRYKGAIRWHYSPKRYLIAIWRSGYATDPNYGVKMCQMVDSINKRL